MMHWACDYIGKPWQAGAQGPDAYDCYGLCIAVQRDHFGRQLPLIADGVDRADKRALAKEFLRPEYREGWVGYWHMPPKDGDLVTMAHARHPTHVGIYLDIDGGGILHCVETHGVVFARLAALKAAGWGRLQFYMPFEST